MIDVSYVAGVADVTAVADVNGIPVCASNSRRLRRGRGRGSGEGAGRGFGDIGDYCYFCILKGGEGGDSARLHSYGLLTCES